MSELERTVDRMLEQDDFDQVEFGDDIEFVIDAAVEYGVPAHVAGALVRYIKLHQPTGGFLYSVLSNDLFKSFAKADPTSAKALDIITKYIYNHAPANCWGSPEAVTQWLSQQ